MHAVIFDMDGLLIDSEPLWVRAEIEIFGEVGVVLDEDDCAKTKGLRIDDVVAYWHDRRPWDTRSRREVEARLIAKMVQLIGAEGVALPGVAEAMAAAKKGGRKVALASSSPRTLIDAVLAVGPEVRLKVLKRIERCAATNVDPATGDRDLMIPRALMRAYDHTDCGIYAAVLAGGVVRTGDAISVVERARSAPMPF